MHSSDEIAAFIEKGGRVVRLQDTIPVTAPEVLKYLVRCGISADYSRRHPRRYIHDGQSIGLRKLVAVANRRRRAERLALFVPRVKLS